MCWEATFWVPPPSRSIFQRWWSPLRLWSDAWANSRATLPVPPAERGALAEMRRAHPVDPAGGQTNTRIIAGYAVSATAFPGARWLSGEQEIRYRSDKFSSREALDDWSPSGRTVPTPRICWAWHAGGFKYVWYSTIEIGYNLEQIGWSPITNTFFWGLKPPTRIPLFFLWWFSDPTSAPRNSRSQVAMVLRAALKWHLGQMSLCHGSPGDGWNWDVNIIPTFSHWLTPF